MSRAFTPGLFANTLAAVEKCVGIFGAALEEYGALVEGARVGGVARLGTGFAAGALYANRNFAEDDAWALNFGLWALTFLTVTEQKRVDLPPVTVNALRSLAYVSAILVFDLCLDSLLVGPDS